MIDRRKWRIAALSFFLLVLLLVMFFCIQAEKQMCMDVKILSESEQAKLREYEYRDLRDLILYNGQPAAVDLPSSTVYIPQNIPEGIQPEDLMGNLEIAGHNFQLFFAPDAAFEDLPAAAAEGHAFKLNVVHRSGSYMQFDLVFTTLPVMRIDGVAVDVNERGRDVYKGEMCLWTPDDPETGRYSVKTSDAIWHVRGGWSATLEKTPFKLDLKKESGGNKNLSFLGLGADDDWVLNPMNLDDTKVKEKLFCGLWNQRAGQVSWNEQMSAGQYVEVVIDGDYWGLFQLQRRIDEKFLNLQTDDVLLKNIADENASAPEAAYEIVYSSLTEEETYSLVTDYYYGRDGDILELNNFLDVNLFLEYAAAIDNIGKNMFHLLRKTADGYDMYLLPWDTDMSWGVVWDEGFAYDYEESNKKSARREEYTWMQKYHPDLDRQMAERWFELRETLLTMETMESILAQELTVLERSGALKRDRDVWGLTYRGEDSLENLHRFLQERLWKLDTNYGEYLQ